MMTTAVEKKQAAGRISRQRVALLSSAARAFPSRHHLFLLFQPV